MAHRTDEVVLRIGGLRTLDHQGSENRSETKQEDAGYRPFAPLSEDFLHRKPPPQELQDEDDDEEEFEINVRSLTKSTTVAQTSDSPTSVASRRANSEEDFKDLSFKIYTFPKDDYENLTAAALQSFKEMMDGVYNSLKAPKRKKNPETAKGRRIERQKNLGRVTKRVQRYLGLRPRAVYASHLSSAASGWNADKPAPFIKDSSVRFVCVDVEAYEMNADLVTEVGLAVLDTDDIMDVAPGKNGENWLSEIETFHFRIKEYSSMINSQFVHGCPGSFAFGNSDFVSLKDIPQEVGNIIGDNASGDKQPVILVGHDIANDLAYLQKVGYNPWRVPHIVDEIDTKSMFQRLKRSQDGRGLETVCSDLGYPGYDFHNAGNDARWTLRDRMRGSGVMESLMTGERLRDRKTQSGKLPNPLLKDESPDSSLIAELPAVRLWPKPAGSLPIPYNSRTFFGTC
ncbi:hypothetical protein DL764_009610 [Monosporascus ibericus]|uniref:Gfd2/YDR514C-like C-terminal domain-containing protein n=1 Tax=Monosporascus ibericus TaxID=155417 RepID=A0A4Q4SXB6_9PEZI|nr:hypothetical protein DL764_009610 [Monosporascus ibericus]